MKNTRVLLMMSDKNLLAFTPKLYWKNALRLTPYAIAIAIGITIFLATNHLKLAIDSKRAIKIYLL